MVNLSTPPMLTGQSAAQLVEYRRYLFRLVDELNHSLNNLTAENFTTEAAKEIGGYTEEAKQELKQTQSELKSLIIKNANTVQAQIQEITHTLESDYVAVSDFGTFQETINKEVSDTASALQSNITATSTITSEFGNYRTKTEGYIRQGIVGFDGITPIIGIAIGQDIIEEEVVIDTHTYNVIKTTNMSVWTPGKLAFFVGGNEVAYFSGEDNALHVNYIETSTIRLRGNWEMDSSDGLAFKWIGGSS